VRASTCNPEVDKQEKPGCKFPPQVKRPALMTARIEGRKETETMAQVQILVDGRVAYAFDASEIDVAILAERKAEELQRAHPGSKVVIRTVK